MAADDEPAPRDGALTVAAGWDRRDSARSMRASPCSASRIGSAPGAATAEDDGPPPRVGALTAARPPWAHAGVPGKAAAEPVAFLVCAPGRAEAGLAAFLACVPGRAAAL